MTNHLDIAKKVKEGYIHHTGRVLEVEFSIFELSPDEVLLTFRGTESSDLIETNGWRDWLRDALICKKLDKTTGTKGHYGFLSGARRVVKKIIQDKLIDRKKKLYVAGHSLGGGMSLPAAHMLKHLGWNVVEWVGFGTPKIYTRDPGSFDFLTTSYRHKNDRVPNLPYSFLGYKKHWVPLTQLGESDGSMGTWKDHSMDLYVKYLESIQKIDN
jgi:hypothetical protein